MATRIDDSGYESNGEEDCEPVFVPVRMRDGSVMYVSEQEAHEIEERQKRHARLRIEEYPAGKSQTANTLLQILFEEFADEEFTKWQADCLIPRLREETRGYGGKTPWQSNSRNLQKLRDDGKLLFVSKGIYKVIAHERRKRRNK